MRTDQLQLMPRQRLLTLLGLVVALCMVSAPQPARAELAPVRIGILAYRGEEEAEKSWASTLAELQRVMPDHQFQLVPGSAPFLTAAVAAHRLDFLITNPGHYLELEIEYSAVAIATVQDMNGVATSESVAATIVVPSGSMDIFQLTDFKNRRLAAISPEAFGYRAALREFLERGINPAEDSQLLFVGFPVEGVLKAVLSGRADGGVVRSCLLEQLVAEGAIKAGAFRVVGRLPSGTSNCQVSTRLYPGWAFVKVAQTSPALSSAVAAALWAMQPGDGDITWTHPEDYAPVQDLYRALKIGPYARFTRLGLADFAWQNRWWGGFISMAALWWVFHALRVAHLLRKRTAELKRAYELSRIKGEQMEHTHRLSLMGEMASSLAHEINQPLAAILSYARGCERRLAAGEDLQGIRAGLERIATQAERAGSIVRRMRDFVKKNPSRQLPVDLGDIVTDALALFEPTAHGRGVRIDTDIPTDLPRVLADRLQIEEVLLNLLQNASEAVGTRADARISVSVIKLDHTLQVSVTDNGAGVAAGAASLLFEAFFTTKQEGLGLGLSLSRTIIEAHGGRLEVDISQPGNTTFRFTLPLMEEDASV